MNAPQPPLYSAPDDRPLRLNSLDGLRGLAALSVVFGHAALIFPVFWDAYLAQTWRASHAPLFVKLLTFTPLHALHASKEAVTIFFVLSGMVLALPILEGRSSAYGLYLFRRGFRLLPVFFLAMVLAFALASWSAAHPQPVGSKWLEAFWTTPPPLYDFFITLLFLGFNSNIDPPVWTLILEVRISLVFPLLAKLVIKYPFRALALSIAFSIFLDVAHGRGWLNVSGSGILAQIERVFIDIITTFKVAVYFVIGICIAKFRVPLQNHILSLRKGMGWAIVSVCLTALFSSWIFPVAPVLFFVGECIGAAGIVILAAFWTPLIKFLDIPICQYLGRISYSLYLVHLPVLLLGVHLFPDVPRIMIVVMSIATALAVAALISQYVEWPMTSLGKRWASKLRASSQG